MTSGGAAASGAGGEGVVTAFSCPQLGHVRHLIGTDMRECLVMGEGKLLDGHNMKCCICGCGFGIAQLGVVGAHRLDSRAIEAGVKGFCDALVACRRREVIKAELMERGSPLPDIFCAVVQSKKGRVEFNSAQYLKPWTPTGGGAVACSDCVALFLADDGAERGLAYYLEKLLIERRRFIRGGLPKFVSAKNNREHPGLSGFKLVGKNVS